LEDWEKIITDCQEEIVQTEPQPHYLSAYKNEEMLYWKNIPMWFYEDSLKNKIENCLDIGCAYGTLSLFAKKLFNCESYLIDFVDLYLSKKLVEDNGFHFKVNNIELDPFPWKETFDRIIFTEVLEHFNFHPVPTLKKIRSLLNGKGILYLSTPDAVQWGKVTKYYSDYYDMPTPNDHVYQFNKDELFDVLEQSGFEIDKFDYSSGVTSRHFNLTATIKN